MRLIEIDTPNLHMVEINENELPPYAILSHTWEEGEVLFADLPLHSTYAQSKRGFSKLQGFFGRARAQGYHYAWADTCCINKASTTELSEAINSMYRWYQKAGKCFAYLADHRNKVTNIEDCRWFSRGWTLQELIAPVEVDFYGSDWSFLGSRSQMRSYLSAITGIEAAVLAGASPDTCSVAQRMFWAAGRQTTRPEDRAYSLLGLFDISLPMIYGASETRNAFVTLQEEIMKHSTDQSIFAWDQSFEKGSRFHLGLLATSPDAFAGCQDVIPSPASGLNASGYSVTNIGISLDLFTIPYAMRTYLAILDCTNKHFPDHRYGILVEQLANPSQFARVSHNGIARKEISLARIFQHSACLERQIRVQQKPGKAINQRYGFWIRSLELPGYDELELRRAKVWSRSQVWEEPASGYFLEMQPGLTGTAGIIYLPAPDIISKWHSICWLKFGFDEDFNPMCIMGNNKTLWGTNRRNLARDYSELIVAARSGPDSKNHMRLFQDKWLQCAEREPRAGSLYWDGICKLETEDSEPLECTIVALGIHLSMKLQQCAPPIGMKNDGSSSSWSIWTVDITKPQVDTAKGAHKKTVADRLALWLGRDSSLLPSQMAQF